METITIAKVQHLITARPEGMPFQTYKEVRKQQHEMLHGRNEIVREGDKYIRRHYPGRLEAAAVIPASVYHGGSSKDFQIVIK
ncbi:MAG: hypothetical protein IK114_14370 [Fibrobacter sp.]|nr:hypothetical protein [Fibrobacter sp.]